MPNLPVKWRRYLYGVGVAFVPLAGLWGWLSDEAAAYAVPLLYAVFMGATALRNVPKDEP